MSAQFPDVPDTLGVPPVQRNDTNTGIDDQPRVSSDGPDLGNAATAAAWGLFDADNNAVVIPDSFVKFAVNESSALIDYPVQGGGFETYNKVQKPYEAKMTVSKGGSIAERHVFLTDITDAKKSLELLTIITPEGTYGNANLQNYDISERTATNGATLLMVNLQLREIRTGVTAAFSNTQKPEGVNTVSGGAVQPQAPTAAETQAADPIQAQG